MKLAPQRIGKLGVVAGAGAALLLACTACCLPLLAPLLAWLGVAGLALMGPVGMLATASVAAAIIWFAVLRRRRRAQCACRSACGG